MPLAVTLKNRSRVEIAWTALGGDENTQSVEAGAWSDKTVQVVGTLGGATVAVQGSNDGTNWSGLSDFLGDPISFTAAGMKLIMENPAYLRVTTSGGTGSDIDVIVSGTLR